MAKKKPVKDTKSPPLSHTWVHFDAKSGLPDRAIEACPTNEETTDYLCNKAGREVPLIPAPGQDDTKALLDVVCGRSASYADGVEDGKASARKVVALDALAAVEKIAALWRASL